jgi:hypothetical protein
MITSKIRLKKPSCQENNFAPISLLVLRIKDKAAHIIEKGKKKRLSWRILYADQRAKHHIALPEVIGKLCLKAPSVFGRSLRGVQ